MTQDSEAGRVFYFGAPG